MNNQNDAGLELLVEFVQERLGQLRQELREKVELAIRIAAGNLTQELIGQAVRSEGQADKAA